MEKSSERLSDLQPGVDYLNPKYFLPEGVPDHIGRFEFLQACERLKIPLEKWPTFDGQPVVLPGWPEPMPGSASSAPKKIGFGVAPLVFTLPAFDICDDDHRAWKRKVNRAWREFCNKEFGPHLRKCTKLRQQLVSQGVITSRKQVRSGGEKRNDIIPQELRYELAARRYCLGASWFDLCTPYRGLYEPDRIRKAVTKILKSLGLDSKRT